MPYPCAVVCYTCERCVWVGGRVTPEAILDLPFGELTNSDESTIQLSDGQDLLTHYADPHCTQANCPHTTAALAAAKAQSPVGLAEQIAELRAQLAELKEQGAG